MKSHTVYKTFNTDQRREFVRITDDVQRAVDEAGIAEGLALVSAMHITAAVWINDDEPGLQADVLLPQPDQRSDRPVHQIRDNHSIHHDER